MEAADYEVKRGHGGAVSFRADGQERFTRLRSSTLGKGYGLEDIQAIIERRASPSGGHTEPRKVNLIIDIQSRMRAGKGPAYERWAKVFNLKQMAATRQYLQENSLLKYSQLDEKAAQATFKRILSGAKLPKMDTLKTERQRLTAEKNAEYPECRAAKKSMEELITAKTNIDHLLGLTDTQKNKKVER